MTVFFSALLRWVALPLLAAALFAGCCGSSACDCQGIRPDALLFTFDSARFTAAQVDTVLLVRSVYPRDTAIITATGTTYAKPDTTLIVRPRAAAFSTPLVIDNTAPFAASNGRKLGYTKPDSSYRYTIVVREPMLPLRRGQELASYYIGRVRLRGDYVADACCSCYRNDEKEFTLTSRYAGSPIRYATINAHAAADAEPVVTVLGR